jgi:peptide/nickel transport system permease protein
LAAFIVRRIVLSIIVLFLVTIFAFLLLHLIPGDPVLTMLGQDASLEQIEMLRKELFLDRPVYEQYGRWLFNVMRGDFGKSIIFRENVVNLINTRLPITMYLSMMAMIFSTFLGIFFGIICAIRRGSVLDQVITVLANFGVTVPLFWLGILGIYLFGLKLGWLPIQGFTSPLDNFVLSVRQSVMPIFCLALPGIAIMTRQTRSSMLEVIRQDYVRTAWSKGLKERTVVMKHAMKNALIPVVTLLGLQLRTLVGGSVLVEQVFNIPGMGRLLVSSVFNKDFVIVQAGTFIIALVVLAANLLVDISYGWLDPRVRYE